jgi:hypothetical protein
MFFAVDKIRNKSPERFEHGPLKERHRGLVASPEIEPGLRLSYTRSARPSYRGIEPPTQACRWRRGTPAKFACQPE